MSGNRAAMAAVLAIVALAAGCSSASGPQTFDQKDDGYTLTCSDDWYRSEAGGGNDLRLMLQEQGDAPGFRDNLFVHVESMETPMTLDKFFAAKEQATSKSPPQLQLTVVEKGPVTLGGQEAQRMVYTMAGGNPPKTAVVWFLVKGNRGYTVMATAATDRFDALRPKIEAVAQTLRLQ